MRRSASLCFCTGWPHQGAAPQRAPVDGDGILSAPDFQVHAQPVALARHLHTLCCLSLLLNLLMKLLYKVASSWGTTPLLKCMPRGPDI